MARQEMVNKMQKKISKMQKNEGELCAKPPAGLAAQGRSRIMKFSTAIQENSITIRDFFCPVFSTNAQKKYIGRKQKKLNAKCENWMNIIDRIP